MKIYPNLCPAVFTLLSFVLIEFPAFGAGLTVGPSQSIQIGIPGVTTNIPLDFLTIHAGGKVELFGTVTFTVAGNVVIDGQIFSLPTAKLPEAEPGEDGEDAVSGLTGGTTGTLGGHGTNWVISTAILTINSQADVLINGSILLRPKLDGGDGGRGGRGGNGAVGAFKLGNQAGAGNEGGLPGLVGALRIVAKNRLELGEASLISLDNLGAGGKGGTGGGGGNGAPGRNGGEDQGGENGGGGGPLGYGGNGGSGRSGGNVSLRADVLTLKGVISANGSPGGQGGAAGLPGFGGKGGNAGPPSSHPPSIPPKGGDGGNAGNWFPTSNINIRGRGGPGGSGGSVTLDARMLIDEGIISVSGGLGGKGGDGWEEGASLGGLGGTPGGMKGQDTAEFPRGTNGAAGPAGLIFVRNPWAGIPNTRFFLPAFLDTSRNGSFGPAPGGGGGSTVYSASANSSNSFRLAAAVNLGSGSVEMFELVFKYRWISTSGSLDVTLAGTNLLHQTAPGTISPAFSEYRVFITDPSILKLFNQNLVLLLNPAPTAAIEIADFVLLTGTDRLRIERTISEPSKVSLSWFGFTNKAYQLQSRPFAAETSWNNVGASMVGRSGLITNSQSVFPAASRQYYRLSVTPQ